MLKARIEKLENQKHGEMQHNDKHCVNREKMKYIYVIIEY